MNIPATMRAAAQTGVGRVEIVEVPTPTPGPGQVLVQTRAVGICGSDVHYFAEGRIGTAVVRYPFVLGHEGAGVVAAVGPGVETPRVGERVALDPALPCFTCDACRGGRLNCCQNVRFLGTPPVGGVFEEYHLFDPEQCVPMPDAMSFEAGAALEPMGVAMHAVNLARLTLGATVAVMGGGTIGMLTASAARLAGASFVAMTEPVTARRAMAAGFGVDLVLPPGDEATRQIREATAGGADTVFEAAGAIEAIDDAVRAARPGGTVVVIGIPLEDCLPIRVHQARGKELTFVLSHRSNHTLVPSIRLIAAGRAAPGAIVTHRFPLEQLQQALDLARAREDGVLKAMIVIGEGTRRD